MNKDLTCYDDADLDGLTEVESSRLFIEQCNARTQALQSEALVVINPLYPGHFSIKFGGNNV